MADDVNNQAQIKLVDLYKTRWVVRSTGLVTFEALFKYAVVTFRAMRTGTRAERNDDSKSSAASLLGSLTGFHVPFIITARVMA